MDLGRGLRDQVIIWPMTACRRFINTQFVLNEKYMVEDALNADVPFVSSLVWDSLDKAFPTGMYHLHGDIIKA